MKVLTVVSTIFIPLTFIVGVYGMNFDNMPELKWPNGYYMVMAFMAMVAVVMLLFLQKEKVALMFKTHIHLLLPYTL